LYNIADSLVAGKFIGENALASVGNSYEVTLIFIAFAFGCNIGCSVIVAQLFGAKEYGKMRTAVSTACIASAALCAVLMAAGLLGCEGLLRLIRTPQEAFADSKLYLDIYIWGMPFVFFYNISTGIFSALGDSRTPFIFLAASSTANVAADILFVTAFGMGVDGVAWATLLCQGVSCVLAVSVVFRRLKQVECQEKFRLFSFPILRKIAVIAIPSILQQSFISAGNIIIQGIINGFGTGVMAGYSAAVKLNNLVITSFTTLGNGVSSYTAQNLGAGRLPRIPAGFRAALKLVWTLSLPLFLLYFFAGRWLLYLFLDVPTQAAVQTGMAFLRILSPFYFVISAKLVADGVLRGSGLMRQFMTATFIDLILRVVLAWALSKTSLGSVGIWCAWPGGWTVATAISLFFYHAGAWNSKRAGDAA
ncbi:MAG: MATE family efflux transporter, partial [Oscillospiraceae bacterium]|nr:MATE family efflux transporter [Oscillospiraceae bacterium]